MGLMHIKNERVVCCDGAQGCLMPGSSVFLSVCLSVSVAFVWQAVRQEESPPQYSEDPTLTQHILVKLKSVCDNY